MDSIPCGFQYLVEEYEKTRMLYFPSIKISTLSHFKYLISESNRKKKKQFNSSYKIKVFQSASFSSILLALYIHLYQTYTKERIGNIQNVGHWSYMEHIYIPNTHTYTQSTYQWTEKRSDGSCSDLCRLTSEMNNTNVLAYQIA